MNQATSAEDPLARIFREEAAGVLSVLIGQVRDFELAEDALQDALAEAVVIWRRDGPPRSGAAWLLTAARRRAIDRLRRATVIRKEASQLELLAQLELGGRETEENQPIPDERLRLIFTCCHPALAQDARVALTLRTLCGLSTGEIGRAFLVSEATMSRRLVRAKNKIRAAAIPYEVPEGSEVTERLASVLDVIYLIFNEGFSATKGASPTRASLCLEAIRLSRVLYQLMPHPEAGGLLAMMLLHDARRDARTDADGAYVPIAEQDRSRWNGELIDQGTKLLLHCLGQHRPGPFQIQAAISALHAEAPSASATDWKQIAALYAALFEITPTAVVTLNRAVAISNVETPAAALALVDTVSDELDGYQPLHAARADLLSRCGRNTDAAAAFRRAISMSGNASERNFLQRKLDQLT